MDKINCLSLFDGISCARLALERAGIKVGKYYASEIDKNAIKVSKHNWPDIVHLGSVTDVKAEELDTIDLLAGGSPCQSFSFCGKRNGMSTVDKQEVLTLEHYLQLKSDGYKFDGQSYLFWEYVRLLKEVKPKYFLLENVRMTKKWQDVISGVLGVEPLLINSSKLSAQNRWRNYWVNLPNVTQPEDKGIMLKDIIKQDYDGIWVWPRGENKGGVQGYKGKSPSLTTSSWEHNFLIYNGEAQRTRYKDEGGSKQVIETRKDGKANALLTGTAKSLLSVKSDELKVEGYINNNSQGNRVYSTEGKSCCLNASSGGAAGNGNALILDKEKVRKFTPEEAEKLQTVPVGYTSCISDHQRYRCLGNGWTVDVIAHILSFLPDEYKNLTAPESQVS